MNKRILLFLFASTLGTVFGFGDIRAAYAQETGLHYDKIKISAFSEFIFNKNTDQFFSLPYDERKLIAYEVGSNNRFLDRKLRVNVSAFYYDYKGLSNTVNLALPQSPVPVFAVVLTSLRMIGAELATEYLLTVEDKITLNAGWLGAKITSYPKIGSLKQYLELSRLPGQPPVTANISYDHTFTFENGAALVPRAELRYTSGEYLNNFTVDRPAVAALKPYGYQNGYVIGNIGATWIGPESKYSATAYVRNVTDKTYKTGVNIGRDLVSNTATVVDPRTFGVMIKAKF